MNRQVTRTLGTVLVCSACILTAAAAAADTIGYSWSAPVFGGDGELYQIVLETGQATPLGIIRGQDIDGGCALPDGRIVGIDGFNRRYWELNPQARVLGVPNMNGVDAGMHYDTTTDTLYAISGGQFHNFESSLLYRVDPSTGATTLVGEDPLHYGDGLAINAQGEAFAIDLTFNQRLYSVDLNTGRLTFVTNITQPQGRILIGGGLAFAPDGTLWMSNDGRGDLYQIDTETGVATFVSTISVHASGFRWNFLAIPLDQPVCTGDLNGDGIVDLGDLGILLADFGCTGGNCAGDLDGDGDTDLADLGILLANFGLICP